MRYGTTAFGGTRSIVRRSPERRLGHRDVPDQLGAAQADLFDIDRPQWLGVGSAAELVGLVDRPSLAPAPDLVEVRIEPAGDDLVHQVEPGESVAGVGDAPGDVGLDAILLNIAPGQCRTPEHDRKP